ncbi:MAG: tyrosine-type recombinase/integrase [Candidatus Sulfotelmatobacter sp.]
MWNGWHAFRRGLATNLRELGVPTKVIQRVCRHADEATTKKHYIHAHRTGRAARRAKAGSVENTRETRETLEQIIVSC